MKIISCVPLPGAGVIARYGDLVAVTDGRGPGPDALLSALAEVAAAAGDGRELVRMAARSALGSSAQSAWACAGVTADGGLAVLVHGGATATVWAGTGNEVTLTAGDSVIPVTRTFTGDMVTVGLALGEPAAPDPRFWLGRGVVPGGGLGVVAGADTAEPAVMTPDAAHPTGAAHLTGACGPGPAGGDETRRPARPLAERPGPPAERPGPPAERPEPPAERPGPPADPVGWHPPTVVTSAVIAEEKDGPATGPHPVLVEGVLCAREHFNDPGARHCRQCGTSLDQPPRNVHLGQRPPLGVLVLDDGTRVTLDGDYVLGREPVLDGEVMAGRARPVRISDPEGTVSRLHLRVSLAGWQVEVSDLGSANGSVLQTPGGKRTLAPFEPMVLEPGARIGIGHRSMQYLAYQGVLS